MAGKGTYLGGSTIISFNKKSREDGWEPEKGFRRKITNKEAEEIINRKKKKKVSGFKNAKPMTRAQRDFFLFAGRCGAREARGEPWPTAPKKILKHYKDDTEKLRKAVVEQASYIQTIKNMKPE